MSTVNSMKADVFLQLVGLRSQLIRRVVRLKPVRSVLWLLALIVASCTGADDRTTQPAEGVSPTIPLSSPVDSVEPETPSAALDTTHTDQPRPATVLETLRSHGVPEFVWRPTTPMPPTEWAQLGLPIYSQAVGGVRVQDIRENWSGAAVFDTAWAFSSGQMTAAQTAELRELFRDEKASFRRSGDFDGDGQPDSAFVGTYQTDFGWEGIFTAVVSYADERQPVVVWLEEIPGADHLTFFPDYSKSAGNSLRAAICVACDGYWDIAVHGKLVTREYDHWTYPAVEYTWERSEGCINSDFEQAERWQSTYRTDSLTASLGTVRVHQGSDGMLNIRSDSSAVSISVFNPYEYGGLAGAAFAEFECRVILALKLSGFGSPTVLASVDPTDGTIDWILNEDDVDTPVIRDQYLYFERAYAVAKIDMFNGEFVWVHNWLYNTHGVRGPMTPIVFAGDTVKFGERVRVDRISGHLYP